MNPFLSSKIERCRARLDELEQWDRRFSHIRLAVFIAICVFLYISALYVNAWIFIALAIACAALFGFILNRHRKLDRTIRTFRFWVDIKESHRARRDLDWDNIPPKPIPQGGYSDHPFARDLNVVGSHSLHQLIDTAIYSESSALLKEWLTATEPEPDRISRRHTLARELTSKTHFRDRIRLQASLAKSSGAGQGKSMDSLLNWMKKPSGFNYRTPLFILGLLSAANIVLLILYIAGLLGPYVIFTFIAYLVISNFNSEKSEHLFDTAFHIEKKLSQFSSILLYLERYTFAPGSALQDFCKRYHQPGKRPSQFLKRIIRLASMATVQQNDVIQFLVNIVLPWDLLVAYKLDSYKTELEPRLRQWLERFYELEALCSIANFAWLNPEYTFSAPVDSGQTAPVFEAKGLGHPLIPKDQKVTNDLTIPAAGNLLLITGSNMAGKSTFLRTVGTNLCLCFAGAPVNASSFSTIPFRLFTSINVKDSLNQGLSHFYAEVKRLRRLLDHLEEPHPHPLFFFVDEIFKGTNNKERLAGSTAFLKEVASRNGIGMISTHDLVLAELDKEIPVLSNWHFEETIEGNKMSFEYKLKPGPCPTTNALKIMEMEGLPGSDG